MSYRKLIRVGLIAPENLATKGGYSVKVYLEAEILSKFGSVTLYGHNLQHSGAYASHDLSEIAPFTRGMRKSLKVFAGLCSTILRSKFDYVFLPTVFNPFFPLLFLAAKVARSKIIYDLRDPLHGTMNTMKDEVNSRTGNKFLTWLMLKLSYRIEALLIRYSNYILTVSPLLVEYVKQFKRHGHENIFLYYNYVPSEVKHVRTEEMPLELQRAIRNKPVICYLGHIQTAIRGIENIFKALKESSNRDICLVLLGEIDDKSYWESLIRENKCEEQILILDPRPTAEALGYLSKCDYAILGPSPDNALPAKIFDTVSVGIKFILPVNMTSAIDVLGDHAVTYRDYPDLVRLLSNLEKPQRNVNSNEIDEFIQQYGLNSRLESICEQIFGKSQHHMDTPDEGSNAHAPEYQSSNRDATVG